MDRASAGDSFEIAFGKMLLANGQGDRFREEPLQPVNADAVTPLGHARRVDGASEVETVQEHDELGVWASYGLHAGLKQ